MKKLITAVLFILFFTVTCYSKRLPYTDELVEAADIIAFWPDDELRKTGDSIKLGHPSTVFTAKEKYLNVEKDPLSGQTMLALNSDALRMLEQYPYSERLNEVVKSIADHERYILFLVLNGGQVDIVGNHGYVESSASAEKVIKGSVTDLTTLTIELA
jgi:hypothetical protein